MATVLHASLGGDQIYIVALVISTPVSEDRRETMKWVTREYVHVDRTACPWLIKRFIDPRAEFFFVPVERIDYTVKKEKAIPYDAPNVELGHHADQCSFDAIVEKYKIKDPPILELAKIVRAADTDKPEVAPEGAGLSAIMTGISMVAKDDFEAVQNATPVYDALYSYCKFKLIKEKYKSEIERMDKKQIRPFLKQKFKE